MVFNWCMSTDATNPDAKLISELGGPARLADELGFDRRAGGVQRVSNWLHRGIPPKVKLSRPDLFLRTQVGQEPSRQNLGPKEAEAA